MTDICPLCSKPISDGDAIFTLPDKDGHIRHYDCWERECSPKALRDTVDKMKATLDKLRKLAGDL